MMTSFFIRLVLLAGSTLYTQGFSRTSSVSRVSVGRIASPTTKLIDAATALGESEESPPTIPTAIYDDQSDHRYSAKDWLDNIRTLPQSSILKAIRGPVVGMAFWGTLVSVIHRLLLERNLGHLARHMCISNKPHSLLVSALGLLLVFRTNSAYQRFNEGRKIWEKILSITRNTSRLASLYEIDLGNPRKQRVFRLLAAFPYLLRHHIQPQCLDVPERARLRGGQDGILLRDSHAINGQGSNLFSLKKAERTAKGNDCWVDRRSLPWCLLPNKALHKCAKATNRPLWVCDRLSLELSNVPYSPNFTSRERLTFLGQVDKLSQCIGECERIHQTAVPLNYARHSLRSLSLWLITLPFALVSELGLLTGPAMATIAWLLLGVYQIGYTIEDPFQGSLRLNILCDAIYRDVMFGIKDEPDPRASAFEMDDEMEEWNMVYEGDRVHTHPKIPKEELILP